MKDEKNVCGSGGSSRKRGPHGWIRRLGMILLGVLFLSGTVVLAKITVTGNISGDTINYKVTGVEPDSDFTVVLVHDETGQGDQYDEHSTGDGKIEGSGTTGDHIGRGDHVTIVVKDKTGKEIARTNIRKGTVGAPWWAYTGIGTIIYFCKKLF